MYYGPDSLSKSNDVSGIFFGGGSGGTPRPHKRLSPPDPPAGGPGGGSPLDGSEVSFLPEKSIFSKKNFKKLTRISDFSKNILKISIFLERPYKSREIPDEFYYLVEKFIKKA